MSPRERRARFQIKRLQHAIITIVALQDGTAQRCGCYTAGCTELSYNSVALRGTQPSQWLARQTREMIECGTDGSTISTKGCNDVGLNRRVIGTRRVIFC